MSTVDASDPAAENPRSKRAILLQGPVGPFFAQLQSCLEASGWNTVRVLFNGGDAHFHGAGREVSYFGQMSKWQEWISGLLADYRPDVMLLFGDQRAVHRDAIAAARRHGVTVVCFEEGYLRPDYVTMEVGGNNACSALRAFSPAHGPAQPPATPLKMPGNGFSYTARYAARYFTVMRASALQFPYYRHHRSRGTVRESMMWMRNAARKWRHQKSNLRKIHWIIEALDARYFLVALQVHDDLQLLQHSAGWSLERLISTSIASFARAAHPDHHLVFKGHPLDRGHSSSREFTLKTAKLFGVADRVHYVDDGSLGLLSRHARGMVTVNSTSAMVAFGHSKPVFACGESFYESMTANGADRSEQALERFWRFTPQLDPQRWEAFRAHMISTTQLNGSFYIDSEIGATCARAVSRIETLLASRASDAADIGAAERGGLSDGQQVA